MPRRLLLLATLIGFGFACALHPEGQPRPPRQDRVETRMARSSKSGARIPQLVRYHDPAIQETVNRQLMALADELRCGSDSRYPDGFESTTKVTYAGDAVLSVAIHASYFCGAAYPTNDDNRSVTFDLKTGSLVSFESLFADYDRDARSILRALYPQQIAHVEELVAAGREESDNCKDSFSFDLDHLLIYGLCYALSQDGIVVQPDFSHVEEACAEEVTVPYDRVRRFAASDSVLARVADAKRSRRRP